MLFGWAIGSNLCSWSDGCGLTRADRNLVASVSSFWPSKGFWEYTLGIHLGIDPKAHVRIKPCSFEPFWVISSQGAIQKPSDPLLHVFLARKSHHETLKCEKAKKWVAGATKNGLLKKLL